MVEKTNWSVMLVDDEPDACRSLKELIEGEHLTDRGDIATVTAVSDFGQARSILDSGRYDLAILDVNDGGRGFEAGKTLQENIADVRFVPIIFHTGWPDHVRELENPPFIQIAPKDERPETLLEAIRKVFSSDLPAVNRALIKHIDKIQREYMWEFVAKNWTEIGGQDDRASIAYLLARRLASSLSDHSIAQFARELAGQFEESSRGRVHPMQYYVMPPMKEPPRMAGDIYRGVLAEEHGYWVMLTPSCDLVQDKAERLVLAACRPLAKQKEYKLWAGRDSGRGNLKRLLSNNRVTQSDRFFYLPSALSIPDLIVDLQEIVSIAPDDFSAGEFIRLATLDSPFAEALTYRFTRFFGRIGTPDLDTDLVINRLLRAGSRDV